MTSEHGPSNDRNASYGALSFLYRQSRGRLAPTDGFAVDQPGEHAYDATLEEREKVTSAFEGENAELTTAMVERYRPQTSVRFRLAIDPDNAGVVFRRTFDANESPTEARLVVDDVAIASLGGARRYSSARRWASEDRFIPARVTRGKTSLDVRIDVVRVLGAARFEALTLRR